MLLAQPVLHKVLTTFFGTIFVVGVTFASVTQYARSETTKGEIAAASGFTTVASEQTGIIADLLVHTGQHVFKGQLLVRIARPQTVAVEGDITAFSIQRMSEALANVDLQITENEATIAATNRQINQITDGAEISSSAAHARRRQTDGRQAVAAQRLHGFEGLAREGFVTQLAVDQVRVQSMQLSQEAADADLAINEIKRGRDERVATLQMHVRELRQVALTLRTQRLQAEKQIHDLRAQQAFAIVAPEAGVVAAISVRPGQRIESGQRIVAIAQPTAKLTVLLEVPSRAIGLIEKGQRVSLKYDAFPFQSFGLRYGRVAHVEDVSLEGGQPTQPDQKDVDRRFLVEVTPEDQSILAYGRARPLRVGMTLSADIEVERRSLLAWWMSPLLSMKGRLT